MSDPLRAFLEGSGLSAPLFPGSSRYHGVPTSVLVTPGGRTVAFLGRRFVPDPRRLASLLEHRVVEGDRLDNLAYRYLGDPELIWQLCDANGAMRPASLVETIGDTVRVALPDGVPGPADD